MIGNILPMAISLGAISAALFFGYELAVVNVNFFLLTLLGVGAIILTGYFLNKSSNSDSTITMRDALIATAITLGVMFTIIGLGVGITLGTA